MTSVYVPFTINNDTQNVRVRIYRTTNEGYLHIDKMYVGGLSLPLPDTTVENIDINKVFIRFHAEIKKIFEEYFDKVCKFLSKIIYINQNSTKCVTLKI